MLTRIIILQKSNSMALAHIRDEMYEKLEGIINVS